MYQNSDNAVYVNYLYHHMRHRFTIVELLLVALEFFCLLRKHFGTSRFRSILNVNRCFQENTVIFLKDKDITLHMIAYMYFSSPEPKA